MANPSTEVDAALWTLLNGTAAITTALDSTVAEPHAIAVYNTTAPRDASTPYIIFQEVTNIPEKAVSGKRWHVMNYIIKVVDKSEWPKNANTVFNQVDEALEEATLTTGLTNFTQVPNRCEFQEAFRLIEDDDGERWYHIGGTYRIEVEETASGV